MSRSKNADSHPHHRHYYYQSSAFLLKARYQRHMLFGMVLASLLVIIPAIVLASWPVSHPVRIMPGPPRDTIIVELPIGEQIYIQPEEQPVTATGGGRHSTGSGSGHWTRDVIPVADSVIFDEDADGFGLASGDGYLGPEGIGDGDFFGGGGGAVVFVEDTTTYGLDAVLDEVPELVFMPSPSYPPRGQRLGVEGAVIIHVLVNIEGRAERVKVFAESVVGYEFGDYAAEAAAGAYFRPAFRHGVPVRCWVSFPVKFTLTR